MSADDNLPLEAFIFVVILILYILTSHVIEIKKVPFLHESGVAITLGLLTAVFAKYALGEQIEFNGEFFFTIILPPIIFSAGYSLRKLLFFQNFWIISYLGILGTIIGFVILTLFVNLLNSVIFKKLSLKDVMLLSSVLCATDTVAAMSLIRPEKYPTLNAVLFGEGIINDAVAIILFKTVEQLNLDDGGFRVQTVFEMMLEFLILLVFSLLIGIISGFGLSYVFKINETFNRFPIKQTSLILLVGYGTYLLGEVLNLSGIIALFTCAVIMGHYSFMNISEESQKGTGLAFETISYVAQAFVYAYLGASLLGISGEWAAVWFSLMLLLLFPVVRAVVIYFPPCLFSLKKKEFPINPKELKVCWYSGMVRGVIAFALSLQIESQNQEFLVTITIVIVLATTLVGAMMLKTFTKCIGLAGANDDDSEPEVSDSHKSSLLEESDYKRIDFGLDSDEKEREEPVAGDWSLKNKFQQFEDKYMIPIFKKEKPKFSYEIEDGSQNREYQLQENGNGNPPQQAHINNSDL